MPLQQNYLMLWILAFVAGAVIGAVIYLVILRNKPKNRVITTQISGGDKVLYEKAIGIIDRMLTSETFSLYDIATELDVQQRQIARLFKRQTGKTFKNCLMESRLEIAKERLRSSNCPEATVAQTCGFRSPSEMNRYFWKFFRTTPSKYRLEQQVT